MDRIYLSIITVHLGSLGLKDGPKDGVVWLVGRVQIICDLVHRPQISLLHMADNFCAGGNHAGLWCLVPHSTEVDGNSGALFLGQRHRLDGTDGSLLHTVQD